MQLNMNNISSLIPKRLYNTIIHGSSYSQPIGPNMPPIIGFFKYQNRRITVYITETVQTRNTTHPYTELSRSAQIELVNRFDQAFHDSPWMTQIAKDVTHAILIYVVEREDPYRPNMPFALAHFANERMEKVGAGRAYKVNGGPQPSYKPPVPKQSVPAESEATDTDEMVLDG